MDHFLSLVDYSKEQIWAFLDKAIALKKAHQTNGTPPLLKGKVLAMVFQKPSLRTRVSFDVAMLHLGGHGLYLSPAEIGLGKRESIADIARVLSGYVDGIMARTFAHEHILALAKHATVPVINGLTDYNHPCQVLADLLTIFEHKGKLAGLKIVYLGDGNNVARSLLFGATKLGMDYAIATPRGYALNQQDIKLGEQFAVQSRATITVVEDPVVAVKGADVIYTDTWTSMGQEEEMAARLAVFPPYQINQELLDHANPDAIVMHCLPAHRGEEITDPVADGPQSALFSQAENRLHAQKGILALLLG